jgi:hypothetical protein
LHCAALLTIPQIMTNSGDNSLNELVEAVSREDQSSIRSWFLAREFFLIVLAGEDDESYSALIVEGDDFASIVVFLEQDRAEAFIEAIEDQLEGEQIELLQVDGETLLDPLTTDIGIVVNPEEEDMVIVTPDLLGAEDQAEEAE